MLARHRAHDQPALITPLDCLSETPNVGPGARLVLRQRDRRDAEDVALTLGRRQLPIDAIEDLARFTEETAQPQQVVCLVVHEVRARPVDVCWAAYVTCDPVVRPVPPGGPCRSPWRTGGYRREHPRHMTREPLRARLTEPARRGWDRTITREGITVTSLCEVLGLEMDAGRWKPPKRMVEAARKLDRQRLSRR